MITWGEAFWLCICDWISFSSGEIFRVHIVLIFENFIHLMISYGQVGRGGLRKGLLGYG